MLERLGLSVKRSFSLEYAVELAGISKGDRVAEIGCDQNIAPALMLANKCDVVYAIDKDFDRIKTYKRELRRRVPPIKKIHPMVAKAEALPFQENSLDGIVFYHSFGYIYVHGGSPAKALKSTHDSLRLGECAISIEYSQTDAEKREKMFNDIRFSVERQGIIVLGKKVLKKALDISSKDEYLGVFERIEKDGERTLKAIREDGERTRKAIKG